MKPEVSIPVAAATMALVYGTYSMALPNLADARTVPAGNGHLAAAERSALLTSVAVAAGVSLVAKDPVPFILGGLFAVGLSWLHRGANAVDPVSGKIAVPGDFGARRYRVEAEG